MEPEVAPIYLAVLLRPRSHRQSGHPKSFPKWQGFFRRMGRGAVSPGARLRNEHLEQKEMRRKANRLSLPSQYQQGWRNPLTCWFGGEKGPSRWRMFFFCLVFELSPALTCYLYGTVVFYCCCLWLLFFLRNKAKFNKTKKQRLPFRLSLRFYRKHLKKINLKNLQGRKRLCWGSATHWNTCC